MSSLMLEHPITHAALAVLSLFVASSWAQGWIQYPSDGTATMTTYSLPENYIAACGCTADSTHYPTAAMSQLAYGSSTAYGPGCGKCFKLTLLNTFLSEPRSILPPSLANFFPSNASYYGKLDFGVWNVSYQTVDCLQDWAGAKSPAALGSVQDGSSVCCPDNPTGNANDTCPSFSEQNGIPPDTTSSSPSYALPTYVLWSTLTYTLVVTSVWFLQCLIC
ncbi:hypothetical protein B0H21DRAFT_775311 [Amylocystis lapponica]|nr:hypothetical protein B0H21DRAFT_775311 [Amylocystis lapponica]